MKKILIFHPVVAPYRIDFFNSLAQNFEVKFCMFYRNLIDQTFEYKKISDLFLYEPVILDQFYKLPFLKIRKHIISTIKDFNPDIIIVPECGYVSLITVLYKILFRKSFKVISIIDDSYDMIANDNFFSLKHKYAEKILIPLFDDVINVEPKVTDCFQKKYHKGIFFPIVQDETRIRNAYQAALPVSQKYIEKYNLQNKKVILFVGRLVKVKNIDFAIKAFLDGNFTDASFVIIGGGEEEKRLKDLAQNNSNVIFTGRLEGEPLYAWYNIAEIFILPSSLEPFGAVTNEALIGGCFCLISNKAGSSCLIENGKNGYTFDISDIDELTRLMKESLERIEPRHYPLELRENRMLFSYKQSIDRLIQEIQ